MEPCTGNIVQLADGRVGIIRFIGQTQFAPGEWVGVELETPTGKNNGSVQGERYFSCAMGHGMFLRPQAVTVIGMAEADDEGVAEEEKEEEALPTSRPQPQRRTTTAPRPSVGTATTAATAAARRGMASNRPSSGFPTIGNSSRTSTTGGDPGLSRRMSLNAPSPSPGPRSSISRAQPKSPTKQLGSGPSSTTTSRTGTPSNSGTRVSSVTARPRPSVGGMRTSMGPPAPVSRTASRPSSTSASNARPVSGTQPRAGTNRLSSSSTVPGTASRIGSRPSSMRAPSGDSGNESGGSGRPDGGQATKAAVSGRASSPQKSSDDGIMSPQPRSPVQSRAAALERLTSGAHKSQTITTAGARPQVPTHTQATVPSTTASAATRSTASTAAINRENEDLKAKLRVLERKRLEDRDKLKQLDKLQTDCDKYQGIIQKIQAKYQPQQQENNELRKQLKEAQALLESVESMQAEHDSAMELATLDREMAEETAEVYKAELDAVKLKVEELELELEVLRVENAEFTQGMTPEEKASASWLQMERNNERLRDALLRLRDITQQQEEELRGEIKSLEEDVRELNAVKEQHDVTKEKLAQAEAAVEDLRQQLDAAQAADDMIMDLTERNMSQAEQLEELKAVIEDLENLKEINDELEINHVQNEREMQEELDFKAAVIQEQARRAAQQEDAYEDMEYALSRFRQMVTSLQNDLEDMRASHAVTENESEQLNSKSRAMMDLNMKLQLSAAKTQVKTIDLELRRMEAQEAEQHLEIVKLFLPDAYLHTDRNSVLALLRFRRVAFKANLLNGFVRERINQPPHPGHEDDIFVGCDVVDKLTWVAAMCDRFVGAISHCTTGRFARFDGALFELEPVERALNGWIDGLRRDELKERTCADELQRSIALLSHLAEVHMSLDVSSDSGQQPQQYASGHGKGNDSGANSSSMEVEEHVGEDLEGFAANLHMRALLMQSHLDSAAVALHTIRAMVQRVIPPMGDDDEEAQYFARRAEMAIAQTRSAKVVASKAVRALEELQMRSLSLMPDTLEAFERCEAASQVLADLARRMGLDLHALLHEDGRTEPYTYSEVQTVVHNASLSLSRAGASATSASAPSDATAAAAATTSIPNASNDDLFTAYLSKLRTVAGQVSDVAALSGDLSQTLEFDRRPAPWVVRGQEVKAPKAVSVDAEEELRRLREEHAEARRVIARRDNEMGTAQLKIETLESRMRDAQNKAAVIEELERSMAAEKTFTKQLKEDVEKQDRELKALEAERDRWKKIASDASLLGVGNGGDGDIIGGAGSTSREGGGVGQSGKERALSTAREIEALRSEVASLQAIVRYLREDNRRARLTEQPNYAWLAEPLVAKKKPRTTARELVATEARDVLGELVKMASAATIYDFSTMPADRLAWRPARTSPQYHAARLAEDYAAWKGWEASVVRKAQEVREVRDVRGGGDSISKPASTRDSRGRRETHKSKGSASARARKQQTRLPDGKVTAKRKTGSGVVHIVGEGTQSWWQQQVHTDGPVYHRA